MTTIKIFKEVIKGKEQLMCSIDGNKGYLGELSLALIFAKDESLIKGLGLYKPDVVVDDQLTPKQEKEVKEFKELLDKFYEKVNK